MKGIRITDLSTKYDLPYDEVKKIVAHLSAGSGADSATVFAQKPNGSFIEVPNDLREDEREQLRLEYINYNRATDEDMQAIASAIECDLPIEVLYFAMKDLRHNPKQSISDAIGYGMCEWIK